jgi:outer membrane murein-binding lipoprotein Lpp
MTIGLYLAGGLVAAAITQLVENAQKDTEDVEQLSQDIL